jgi:hypothetical protein
MSGRQLRNEQRGNDRREEYPEVNIEITEPSKFLK